MHVLIFYFLQIDMLAEVLIGGEWCTELYGMSLSHVAFDTLAARSAREDSDFERTTSLMFTDSTLREFTEHRLRVAVGCESTDCYVVAVMNELCGLGSRHPCICHNLLYINS